MGRSSIEGETPVIEIVMSMVSTSRAGHVESRLKIGGPSPKAKYSLVTDSEPVQ
jgi:hypothetical protein